MLDVYWRCEIFVSHLKNSLRQLPVSKKFQLGKKKNSSKEVNSFLRQNVIVCLTKFSKSTKILQKITLSFLFGLSFLIVSAFWPDQGPKFTT